MRHREHEAWTPVGGRSQRAVRLRRKSPAVLTGNYESIGKGPHLFIFRRRGGGQEIIVALNMSDAYRDVELGDKIQARMMLSSLPSRVATSKDSRIILHPFEAVVLEVVPR